VTRGSGPERSRKFPGRHPAAGMGLQTQQRTGCKGGPHRPLIPGQPLTIPCAALGTQYPVATMLRPSRP